MPQILVYVFLLGSLGSRASVNCQLCYKSLKDRWIDCIRGCIELTDVVRPLHFHRHLFISLVIALDSLNNCHCGQVLDENNWC